jgi:hypothetical protein
LVWIWIGFRETHPPVQDKRFDAFAALTNLATVFTDRDAPALCERSVA